MRQLVEYKKFKDAADRLLEFEALQHEVFTFGGDRPVFEKTSVDVGQALGDIGLFDLLTAFQEVLSRAPAEPFGHLEPILWSVPDKMEVISTKLRDQRRLEFSKLFNPESHRNEVIATFLALLELLRLRQIRIQQNAAFHEILILPIEDAAGKPLLPTSNEGAEHVES